VTAAADLYALGIVAWECLTGRPPFHGTPIEVVVAHRDQALPPLPGSVPAEVAALVAELTAKDPAERPASAGEVAGRAAGLRDRLAREAGVSACPLAGPWSRAAQAGPSGPVGVSTVPSSEVDLFKRAFDPPPSSREQSPVPPEPPPARRRSRWLWLALGPVAAAVVATGVTVTQLTGAGTLAHQPPGSARQRSPAASATPGTGGHHTGPSPAGRAPTGAAGGPGAGTAPQASRPVAAAATAPAVTGSRPATTSSASPAPSPTSSTGNGKGKAKGKGNGNGQGKGNGNGQGNG
jgi:serine/threonine-protein kinase